MPRHADTGKITNVRSLSPPPQCKVEVAHSKGALEEHLRHAIKGDTLDYVFS